MTSNDENYWKETAVDYRKFAADFTGRFASSATADVYQSRAAGVPFPSDNIRCLDIAAGTGTAAFSLIDAICNQNPNEAVSLLATDLCPGMLEQLEEQVPNRVTSKYPNVTVTTKPCDMQDLSSIVADSSIDICTCVFGILFSSDPIKALAEIKRVLAPNGVAVIVSWTWNSMIQDVLEAALELGTISNLSEFTLPAMDLGHEHHFRMTARQAELENVSVSYIQCNDLPFPLDMVVSSVKSNPAFAHIAPFDEEKLTEFLLARCQGENNKQGRMLTVAGTALALKTTALC